MKKVLVVLLIIAVVGCPFLFATAADRYSVTTINIASDTDISEQRVAQIKQSFDLESQQGKNDYVKRVFAEFNIDESIIELLSAEKIEMIVNAEEFGFKQEEPSEKNRSGSGGYETQDEDMYRGIMWAKNGYRYLILGTCSWLDIPFMRLKDTVDIGLTAGGVIDDSQNLIMRYRRKNDPAGEYTEEYFYKSDEEYVGESNNCTFIVDLPNYMLVNGVEELDFIITAVYEIKPYQTANLSLAYYHKNSPCVTSISISYIGGLSLQPESLHTKYSVQTVITE